MERTNLPVSQKPPLDLARYIKRGAGISKNILEGEINLGTGSYIVETREKLETETQIRNFGNLSEKFIFFPTSGTQPLWKRGITLT